MRDESGVCLDATTVRLGAGIVTCLLVLGSITTFVAGAGAAGTAPGSGAVHGFHVTAQPQVVADAVAVESVFVMRDGFVVVRTDDGGSPGEVLGHAPAPLGGHEDVDVAIDGEGLAGDEPTSLWVVIHEDGDGDGEFDPAEDPPIEMAGALVGTRFPVRSGSQPVAVVAPGLDGQPSNGSVTVRRVALAERGYLAVHDVSDGEAGRVVGSTALSPGTHGNVTVDIDREYFEAQPDEFDLRSVAYVDDGDGEFDPGTDGRIRVDGDPVASRVPVRKVREPGTGTATGIADGSDPVVVTATDDGTTVETVDDREEEPLATPDVGPPGALLAVVLAVSVGALARRVR